MAEAVPAIRLTDPDNRDQATSPILSPDRDGSPSESNGLTRTIPARPTTPVAKEKSNRPESTGGWTSPRGLIRSLSSNNASFSNGVSREETNGQQDVNSASPPGIDPLSQHILNRTNTPLNSSGVRPTTAEGTANKDERASIDRSPAPPVQPPGPQRTYTQDTIETVNSQKDLRKGVKAVSFIHRLMGNKKREEEEIVADDESVSNEGRPEGNDAEVFAQPVDNIGFSPRQPQPPAYIKVRAKFKKAREFDRLFLAQELQCRKERKVERQGSTNKLRRKSSTPASASTVWAMEFSRDGRYLAAAGADGIVRVWAVLSSSEDRQKHEKQEASESEANGANPHAEHLSAPVFQSQPVREYEGHKSTVLDLSWSKNNFLLSSSMDKTVRLWHVSRSECLCTFKHNDFVPSIAFHPKDDRFFLAGSLDSKLRLWSIPDKSVAFTAPLADMITAVAFTLDGKSAMAGCLSGLCMFYETEGLKYQSQIHVRSSRGQNAKGSKITGIQSYQDVRGGVKLLITSNDSRVRVYNMRDKNLELKFRGNENNYSQIRASISDDGRYIVCGSEDRKAYLWSMGPCESEKRDRRPMEMFEAHDTITTVVCMAPAKTRHHLSKSEDPIYDLCNPPPVTLMSRAERAGSQSSSRPPTENGSIQATPAEFEGRFEKPKESPSFLTRSSHKDGNIIVTADFMGSIKVFRQDCAWQKRRADDADRSSLFSRRNGRMSRNGSIMTRGSQPSLKEGRKSTSISAPSDRIMSWRQGIVSTPSIDGSSQRRPSRNNSSRSISPSKSLDQKGGEQQTRKASDPIWKGLSTYRKTSNSTENAPTINTAQAREATLNGNRRESGSPKSMKDENPLMIEGGRSYLYYDTENWKTRAAQQQERHKVAEQTPLSPVMSRDDDHLAVRPPLDRGRTDVSELSDEKSSASEYDDAPEQGDMKCRNCASRSFSMRKLKNSGTCMACTRCGERA